MYARAQGWKVYSQYQPQRPYAWHPRSPRACSPSQANRYLSPECGTASGVRRRVSAYGFNPQRCAFELQQRGALNQACTVLAQKAFRLVLTVPGGVILKLAGAAVAGGREIPWPQVSLWATTLRELYLMVVRV